MRPFGGGLWDGLTPGMGPSRLTCRCLLAESEDGLVLVDTGFGMGDVFDPEERLPGVARHATRVRVAPEDTAIVQVRTLGFDPKDVRHIVMTHLDYDHAGGLTDFPWATVHVSGREARDARARRGLTGAMRYRPGQLRRDMREHDRLGQNWFGFAAFREGLPPGFVLVPLPGHTAGHCGVAVRTGAGWLLHAGDAVFNLRELRAAPRCPPFALAYETMMQRSGRIAAASQAALRALLRGHSDEVQVICTHDPVADPFLPEMASRAA